MPLDMLVEGSSRRRFTQALLCTAAASAAGGAEAQYAGGTGRVIPYNCKATQEIQTGSFPAYNYACKPVSDLSLLTLGLNLEYLEATFYLFATTGAGLPASQKGGQPGTVSGGRNATLTNPSVSALARELAIEERQHVDVLRNTIVSMGMVPVSLPSIDFDAGFNYIMRQAGIVGPNATFDAFANDLNFLLACYVFEDLLVTLYRGAIPLIASKPTLDLVGGLAAAEGYHAGIVRTLLFAMGESGTNAISYVRSVLDGSAGTPAQGNDHGIGTLRAPSLVNADSFGIVEGRSTRQIVDITYDAAADSSPTLRLPRYFFTQGLSSPY